MSGCGILEKYQDYNINKPLQIHLNMQSQVRT